MVGSRPAVSPFAGSHLDAVRIRDALRDVLESAPFRSSRQSQVFLNYVVERTLAGEHDLLRERVIGAEVFGRGPDYEPSDDPVVRVRAAEVRKRLAQYYQTSASSAVRIDIPSGSYRAVFELKQEQQPLAPPVHKPGRRWRLQWIAFALLTVAASAVTIRELHSPSPSALDQFWAPVLASPKPVLIYNATSSVFRPSDSTGPAHEFLPVLGQYTCIGDAYASVVLGSLFSGKRKLYQMRYGSDLTFGDLRYQPSILIGAFNNSWTLQTTNELRFVFEKHPTIRDRVGKRLYTLPDLKPDGRTPEDYAIVSRVFDSKTGELLIAAAGITQYGTRAAGEFLTSSRLMTTFTASAPKDWPKKNLQVLIHTKIVDETPGPPVVVASTFW